MIRLWTVTSHDEWMPPSGRRHAFRDYWVLNLSLTSNGTCTYDSSLKMWEKCSVPCTTPFSTWPLMLSIFTRDRLSLKWSTVVIFRQELPSPYFLVSIESKTSHSPCRWQIIFHPPTALSQVGYGKPLTTLSFTFMEFPQTAFLGSNLHGQDPPCHSPCNKPPIFSSYSIGEK